jgi:hypothetical protein
MVGQLQASELAGMIAITRFKHVGKTAAPDR